MKILTVQKVEIMERNQKRNFKIDEEIEQVLNDRKNNLPSKQMVFDGLRSCDCHEVSEIACLACPYGKLGDQCKDKLISDSLFIMSELNDTVSDLTFGHARSISIALYELVNVSIYK